MRFDIISIVVGILVAVLVAFSTIFRAIRTQRRRADRSKPTPRPAVFSLAELVAMRETGQITPQEFDRLRAVPGIFGDINAVSTRTRGFDVLQNPPPQ